MDIRRKDIPEHIHEEAFAYRMEFDPRERTPAPERWARFQIWLCDPLHATAYRIADYNYNLSASFFGRRQPRPS